MQLSFSKYQGTGNDFILLDNRNGDIHLDRESIARLCDRRFGIGADGLMFLEIAAGADFRMVYYNSDGRQSTMCGNGGRCIVAFAEKLNVISAKKAVFLAVDGMHDATIQPDGNVSLGMQPVGSILHNDEFSVLNTGSPHHIRWVDDVSIVEVFAEGRRIRTAAGPDGINVNFVQRSPEGLQVRTYERGVEDETLSCGTGVTAAAIAASGDKVGHFDTAVHTPGGKLMVSFDKPSPDTAGNVVLTGPAVLVFEGTISL